MRKLLSVGALAAASLFTAWQPAAIAGQRPAIVIAPNHNQVRHWHHWERWHNRHWRYERGYRQDGHHVRGYWYR